MADGVYEFYCGSYAEETEEGIVKFRLDAKEGEIKKVYGYKGIFKPSYIDFNSSKTILYCVQEENPAGKVHAMKIEETGLAHLNDLPTEGADPCYLSFGGNGRFMFAANYTGGSVSAFKLADSGLLEGLSDLAVHNGCGFNPVRQESAHVHCIREIKRKVFVTDLGLDKVLIYDIDYETGKIRSSGNCIEFPPGSGPRHIEICHSIPEVIYIVCELSNQVAVLKKEGEKYIISQLISTLPKNCTAENTAAAIKVYGSFLFVSNRGHDSIAVYRIMQDGKLKLKQILPSGGKTPRDFSVFGDYMVIANQESDLITVLKFNRETEMLEPAEISAEVIRPSCIREYR